MNKAINAIKLKYRDRLNKWTIPSGEMLNDIDTLLDEVEQMQKLLLEIRDNPKLWKRGGAGGQDQYAGLPPFCRMIDSVTKPKEQADEHPLSRFI